MAAHPDAGWPELPVRTTPPYADGGSATEVLFNQLTQPVDFVANYVEWMGRAGAVAQVLPSRAQRDALGDRITPTCFVFERGGAGSLSARAVGVPCRGPGG